MFDKEAYWNNRKAGKRGQGAIPLPVYHEGPNPAKLVKIQGEEQYIPRRDRRTMMRRFMKAIRTGKVDIQELMKRKREQDASREED